MNSNSVSSVGVSAPNPVSWHLFASVHSEVGALLRVLLEPLLQQLHVPANVSQHHAVSETLFWGVAYLSCLSLKVPNSRLRSRTSSKSVSSLLLYVSACERSGLRASDVQPDERVL